MKKKVLAPATFEFDDGSAFSVGEDESEVWLRAFHMKTGDQGMTLDDGVRFVRRHIDEFWRNRTTLTMFGMVAWEREYKDKAELCRECLYWYLRAYIMACSIEEKDGENGAGEIQVVIRDRNGFRVITEDGAKKINSLAEIVKAGRD